MVTCLFAIILKCLLTNAPMQVFMVSTTIPITIPTFSSLAKVVKIEAPRSTEAKRLQASGLMQNITYARLQILHIIYWFFKFK